MPLLVVKWNWFFRSRKPSSLAGAVKLATLAIDYEVLFSDVPCVWLRKDIRHCMKRGIWTPFYVIRISDLLGTERHLGAGQCVTGAGAERTIAMSLPEFEQSLFMAAHPTICYWRPRRATVSTTINSTTAVGCSSSPV